MLRIVVVLLALVTCHSAAANPADVPSDAPLRVGVLLLESDSAEAQGYHHYLVGALQLNFRKEKLQVANILVPAADQPADLLDAAGIDAVAHLLEEDLLDTLILLDARTLPDQPAVDLSQTLQVDWMLFDMHGMTAYGSHATSTLLELEADCTGNCRNRELNRQIVRLALSQAPEVVADIRRHHQPTAVEQKVAAREPVTAATSS